MNFLSHIFLSGDSEELMIGNYIADSVKGSAFNEYPGEIKEGIILHRHIDTYTDSHAVVEKSKERLRPNYKKYSGVIVDVYYDHFLAANWNDYSDVSLDEFTKNVYRLMQQHKHTFPLKSQLFTRYMLEHNILTAYAKLEGIERVLQGMARRTTFESNMEHAIHDLKEHYTLFENEFRKFFPELQAFVKSRLLKRQ